MKKKTMWISAGALAAVLIAGGVGVAVADPFDDDRLTGSALDDATEAALAEVGDGEVTDAERSNDDGRVAYEIEITRENGGEVDVELDESFAVVRVDRDDDGASNGASSVDGSAPDSASVSEPITDSERQDAEAATLAEVGSGTVTELERSDDRDHAWEVEVTTAEGVEVDIELDSEFVVTRTDR